MKRLCFKNFKDEDNCFKSLSHSGGQCVIAMDNSYLHIYGDLYLWLFLL